MASGVVRDATSIQCDTRLDDWWIVHTLNNKIRGKAKVPNATANRAGGKLNGGDRAPIRLIRTRYATVYGYCILRVMSGKLKADP